MSLLKQGRPSSISAVLFDLGGTLVEERGPTKGEPRNVAPVPGATRMVRGLSRRYAVGVVSNVPPWVRLAVPRILERAGFDVNDFDVIVSSRDVGVRKPDPRIFRAALRRLRVPANRSVAVGNRLDTDIAGAHRAGMVAILFSRGDYPQPEKALEEPDYRLRSMGGLARLLKRIETDSDD